MEPSEIPAADSQSPPKKELQPQSPRNSPLKVSKDSHKIKKPPQPWSPPPLDVSDFMPLVQGGVTGLDTFPPVSSSWPTTSSSWPTSSSFSVDSDANVVVQPGAAHSSSDPNVVVPPSAHSSSGAGAGANVVVPPAAHSGSIETSSGDSNSPYSEEEESARKDGN